MEHSRNKERRSVFVAGGTGYIGRRLISRLLDRGHEVRALIRSGPGASLAVFAASDLQTCRTPYRKLAMAHNALVW